MEHGIYLAASGYDYASEVVGPLGVLSTVDMSGPGVAVADIDLSQHFRETWLGDWRDISNKERRSAPYKYPVSPTSPSNGPPPDSIAPTVTLTSPSAGAAVSGSVSVAATASDDVGVARVRFLVDSTPIGADDTTAPYSISWNTAAAANGSHTVAAIAFDAAGNSASATLNVIVANDIGSTGKAVPGTIQAEDYDVGGEGVGYHDSSVGNSGGAYRTDNVDIEASTDAGGGFNVGWMDAAEWLKYTVSVGATGTYRLTARVACDGPGGTVHVEFGGVDVTGPLIIPNTGDWQSWTDVTATVTLTAGVQSMRFVVDRAGPTGVVGNLNYIRLESAGVTASGAAPY